MKPTQKNIFFRNITYMKLFLCHIFVFQLFLLLDIFFNVLLILFNFIDMNSKSLKITLSKKQSSFAQTRTSLLANSNVSRTASIESRKGRSMSLRKHTVQQNLEESVCREIHFNEKQRKKHFINVIDGYFKCTSPDKRVEFSSLFELNDDFCSSPSKSNRQIFSEQSNRVSRIRESFKTKRFNKMHSYLIRQQSKNLPTITQSFNYTCRPKSQNKKNSQQIFKDISQSYILFDDKSTPLQKKTIDYSKDTDFMFNKTFNSSFTRSISPEKSYEKLSEFKKNVCSKELKVKKYNIPILWQQSNKITNRIQKIKPLSQQLYSIVQSNSGSEKLLNIYPKQEYYLLFRNNNQFLRDIIINLCKQFIQTKDSVIHPNICINSIYRLQQKSVVIDHWGLSAFKDVIIIRNRSITTFIQPILKQNKQWLIIPEYLSPQFINDQMNKWRTKNVWNISSSSHIWMLGCLILEILTLIPLWTPYRCSIKNSNKRKRGVMNVKHRDLQHIVEKQKNFVSSGVRNSLKQTIVPIEQIRPQIIEIVINCLKLNPSERYSPQKIIKILQN